MRRIYGDGGGLVGVAAVVFCLFSLLDGGLHIIMSSGHKRTQFRRQSQSNHAGGTDGRRSREWW